ncbi:MAG: ribonuclease III [Pyramidobacter sp.]|nr:ribonuclease III [Pyramidobacter sp.]
MITEREAARRSALAEFQRRIGHVFADAGLLEEALTHSSYAHELGLPYWNERLEFLGDAVLELLTSDVIFHALPSAAEGVMTRERASLVCEKTLAAWGRSLGVEKVLRAGKGQRSSISSAMIADAVEAILGALYLDGGLETARAFLDSRPAKSAGGGAFDPKSQLQILTQEHGHEMPEYQLVSREGPEHNPHFTVRVFLSGTCMAEGHGTSRKAAEQDAAANALERMNPAL